MSRTGLHAHQESWYPGPCMDEGPMWKCPHQCHTCTHSPHPPSHVFSIPICLCTHTHTERGKSHESSSCVTCMGICRSTEAHHQPATLADRTKEETATRKLEIMTSTFISKIAITQPAYCPAPVCSKQIYLLERWLYCDLTFPCFISLTLIPHYWKHITMAAGSTRASHG